MPTIIVHRPGCPDLLAGGYNVVVGEIQQLTRDIKNLMTAHGIPFYNVQPHNESCPGRHFPWEDLEFNLFILEH